MDDAIVARIQQDMGAWKLFYNETTGLLTIQQGTDPSCAYECSQVKLLHPSQEQLQQLACSAVYDALDIALSVDGYANDPTSLDGFAAWCDDTDALGDGKTTVREALTAWRECWQVRERLEVFLTRDCLLSYLKLYFIEDETDRV